MTATQVGVLTAIEVAMRVLCLIPAAYLADKHYREDDAGAWPTWQTHLSTIGTSLTRLWC
jgi:hypothetical protein